MVQSVTYNYDAQSGQLNSLTGTNFGGTGSTTLASNLQYRAWGALKHLTYGNTLQLDLTYTPRQQVKQQSLKAPGIPTSSQVNRVNDYSYYADGRIKSMTDEADSRFNRAYTYDQMARLTQALTGYEALGQPSGALSPYKETFSYNEWSDLTDRFTRSWTKQFGMGGPIAYQNGRRADWSYDNEGHVTLDSNFSQYDAAGQKTYSSGGAYSVTQVYDGEGRRTKRTEVYATGTLPNRTTTTTITYDVRSTVLGGAVVETLDASGVKTDGSAYSLNGELIATASGTDVLYSNYDPFVMSQQQSRANAVAAARTEYDPLGGDAGTENPYDDVDDPGRDFPIRNGSLSAPANGCLIDDLPGDCRDMTLLINSGARVYFTYQRQAAITIEYDRNTGLSGYRGRWIPNSVQHEIRTYPDGTVFDIAYISSDAHWEIIPFTGDGDPQQTTPTPQNPYPSLNKNDLKVVQDSIKTAQGLTKNKDCDQALKAYGIPSLAALINGLKPNSNLFDGRASTLTGPIGENGATESVADYFKENKTSVGAAVFHNSVTGRGQVTFLGDYFFNPASVQNLAQQRAIILLHEAVHQVNGAGDSVFGGSKALSDKIIDKCFPVLKGKLGGVG